MGKGQKNNQEGAPTGNTSETKAVAVPKIEDDASDEEGHPISIEELVNKFLSSLSPAVRNRVKFLQHLQGEHTKLYKEYLREIELLEKKYNTLWDPLYKKRAEVVTGATEVTAEDLAKIEAENKDAQKPQATETKPADNNNNADEKGIPGFWLTAMSNHEVLADAIQERDQEALKALTDITFVTLDVAEDPDTKEKRTAFRLDFHFAENPFFTNKVLSKTYTLFDDGDEFSLDKAEGTKIDWKEGQNLTVITVKKKQRHKSGKSSRSVSKTEPCDSFFNFFNPPSHPEDDEEMDDEALENLEDLIEADYELGQIIKEKLIKEAVNYYTGSVISDRPYLGGMYGDDDEEDYDDEDDDEEEEEAPKKGGNKRKASGGAGAGAAAGGPQGQDKPECKQQ